MIRSATGQLYALDAVTGALLWMQNVDGNGTDITIGDSLMVVPSGTSLLGYAISKPRTP